MDDRSLLRDILIVGLIVFVIWYLFKSGKLHLTALSKHAATTSGSAAGAGPGASAGYAGGGGCCGSFQVAGGTGSEKAATASGVLSPSAPSLEEHAGTSFYKGVTTYG